MHLAVIVICNISVLYQYIEVVMEVIELQKYIH